MDDNTNAPRGNKGFYRLKDVLKRFPVSRSRWYEGVKRGEYPAPIKIAANISAWRIEDIEALIDSFVAVSKTGNSGS